MLSLLSVMVLGVVVVLLVSWMYDSVKSNRRANDSISGAVVGLYCNWPDLESQIRSSLRASGVKCLSMRRESVRGLMPGPGAKQWRKSWVPGGVRPDIGCICVFEPTRYYRDERVDGQFAFTIFAVGTREPCVIEWNVRTVENRLYWLPVEAGNLARELKRSLRFR